MSGEFNTFNFFEKTCLVADSKFFKDHRKCCRQIEARMWTCHLDDIQKHWNGNTCIFKMHGHSNVRFVVWRGPWVSRKVQSTDMFLTPQKWVFFFFESLALLTCNIFVMRLRTLINTFLTSRETVSGEGMWYSGLPVFMSIWNPRSFTILKGRLLSDTQRTISALQGYRMRWEKSTRGEYEYLT